MNKRAKAFALISLFAGALFASAANAKEAQTTAEQEAAYTRAINGRAERIVKKLDLTDSTEAARVQAIIVQQYRDLRAIDDPRDAGVKAVKADKGLDKAARATAIKAIETDSKLKTFELHNAFIGSLLSELTPKQVGEVKDGMTYGVLEVTYNAYVKMLPNLSAAQKRQIYAWLAEAREYAMDAGSSHAKHAWFGKFKGRINNYLAKAGIDMKQAEHDYISRMKAREAAK